MVVCLSFVTSFLLTWQISCKGTDLAVKKMITTGNKIIIIKKHRVRKFKVTTYSKSKGASAGHLVQIQKKADYIFSACMYSKSRKVKICGEVQVA